MFVSISHFFQGNLLFWFGFANSKYLFLVVFFKSIHLSLSLSDVFHIRIGKICDVPIQRMFNQKKKTAKWNNKAKFINSINKRNLGLSITVSFFNMYMLKQRLIQSLIDLKTVNATLTKYIYAHLCQSLYVFLFRSQDLNYKYLW